MRPRHAGSQLARHAPLMHQVPSAQRRQRPSQQVAPAAQVPQLRVPVASRPHSRSGQVDGSAAQTHCPAALHVAPPEQMPEPPLAWHSPPHPSGPQTRPSQRGVQEPVQVPLTQVW